MEANCWNVKLIDSTVASVCAIVMWLEDMDKCLHWITELGWIFVVSAIWCAI